MDFESLASKFSLYRQISSYEQKTKGSLPKPLSAAESIQNQNVDKSEAVISNIGDNGFQTRLYKHISDYYAGEGQLSKDTNREIAQKDNNVSNNLNIEDPKAGSQYSGYRTAGFGYSTKARFISGVESSTKLSTSIRKIYSA